MRLPLITCIALALAASGCHEQRRNAPTPESSRDLIEWGEAIEIAGPHEGSPTRLVVSGQVSNMGLPCGTGVPSTDDIVVTAREHESRVVLTAHHDESLGEVAAWSTANTCMGVPVRWDRIVYLRKPVGTRRLIDAACECERRERPGSERPPLRVFAASEG